MTKRFNWNYETAHPIGRSHVADARAQTIAAFHGEPDPLDKPLPRKTSSQIAHEEELAAYHNPTLLRTIYS